MYTYIHT